MFFDAAALLSAAGSPRGGPAAILDLHMKGHLAAVISDAVQSEAERNVERKLLGVSVPALRSMVDRLHVRAVIMPSAIVDNFSAINEKDRHVYAAALLAGADYVITHDRALIAEINAQGGVRALTPGDFLQQIAPALLAADDDSGIEG